MGKIICTNGMGIPHRSFEEEFLTHKKCSEWWYCTGYLEDGKKGALFGYQFTLAQVHIFGFKFRILIMSLTDLATGKHYNSQGPIFFGKGVTATADLLEVKGKTRVIFAPNEYSSKGKMILNMTCDDFIIDVELNAVKPPVWQCDDGVLQMGIPGEKERTYYYSFTNLTAKGSLSVGGQKYDNLTGKTWFDRQGGTYTLTDSRTCWEWFSLRFFDNTEVMLFAFPQDGYYDGTYIEADGCYHRLNAYKLEATKVITFNGEKYSGEWRLKVNDKEYTIVPKLDGMFNLFFFELLADIKDKDDNLLGYCVVELLPGVRNKTSGFNAFKRKK